MKTGRRMVQVVSFDKHLTDFHRTFPGTAKNVSQYHQEGCKKRKHDYPSLHQWFNFNSANQ